MVDLIKFWFIQERELVYNAPRSKDFEISKKETTAHTLPNAIGLTSFGFSMKTL